jgi:hypothetical protein
MHSDALHLTMGACCRALEDSGAVSPKGHPARNALSAGQIRRESEIDSGRLTGMAANQWQETISWADMVSVIACMEASISTICPD